MRTELYKLPSDLELDIEAHARDVERFLAGELAPGIFKARRVPRGIYEQRKNGTYMMRVRVAGGFITAKQAKCLAGIAAGYSNGLLHVTTRQDMQLHDVKIEDTPAIMREIMGVGLTSRGGGGNTVRNVTACPYAGVCPSERFDVAPFARAVTEYLISIEGSYNLPRKYKIAFSGCRADCALARANDLGFIAADRNGEPGFELYAGGGMGAKSRLADKLEEWVPAGDVVVIAEAVRRIFDRMGDRHNKHKARLRFVFDRIGAEAFKKELTCELTALREYNIPAADCRIDLRATAADCLPEKQSGPMGISYLQQHQNGRVAIPLHIPLGFIQSGDFDLLANIADEFSDEKGFCTTREQNIVIRHVSQENLEGLAEELGNMSIDTTSSAALSHFVACAGASTCRLGLCLSRGAASACADVLNGNDGMGVILDGLQINISGCPNACGHHPMASVGFFGSSMRKDGHLAPCYKMVMGGRDDLGAVCLAYSIGTLPARALPGFIRNMGEDFQDRRSSGETFNDYVIRRGVGYFEEMAAGHSELPFYQDNPEYYRDWGTDEDFSLAGRGAGECGAGVFEVVSDDIDLARKTLKEMESGEKPELLYKSFLAAVRALLITRGVDSGGPSSLLAAFKQHFVETGLVSVEFEELRSAVECDPDGWGTSLAGHLDHLRKLLDRVELLYSSMDASLDFHLPDGETKKKLQMIPVSANAVVEMDLRGVACPMNFVKAKLKLETITVGDTLRIMLDDGEPVRNVPASFKSEGQEVNLIRDMGQGFWSVEIRRCK